MQRTPNVVETLLMTAEAEEFIPAFKKNHVNLSALLIITDEDLQIIGVKDEQLRKNILHERDIFAERKQRLDFTLEEYFVNQILKEINWQLRLLHPLIKNSAAAKIERTENELHQATTCLKNCVDSFQKELQTFAEFVDPNRTAKEKTRWDGVIFVLLVSAASYYAVRHCLR